MDWSAVILLVTGAAVGIITKIIWAYIGRRDKDNASKIDVATEINSIRREFDEKLQKTVNKLGDEIKEIGKKVDKWASELLKHYATKSDLDKLEDKCQEIEVTIGKNQTSVATHDSQIKELFSKVDKLNS